MAKANSLSVNPTFSFRFVKRKLDVPPWVSADSSPLSSSVAGSTDRVSASKSGCGVFGTSFATLAEVRLFNLQEVSDAFDKNHNGFVCAFELRGTRAYNKDPLFVATAVTEVLAQDELRNELAAAGRKRVETFDLPVTGPQFVETLRAMMDQP